LNPTGLTRENVLVELSHVKLCNLIRYQQTGLLHHITSLLNLQEATTTSSSQAFDNYSLRKPHILRKH